MANFLKTGQLFSHFPLAPGAICSVLVAIFQRGMCACECGVVGASLLLMLLCRGYQVCGERRGLCSAPAYPCSGEGGKFPLWLLSPTAQCNCAEAQNTLPQRNTKVSPGISLWLWKSLSAWSSPLEEGLSHGHCVCSSGCLGVTLEVMALSSLASNIHPHHHLPET